MSKEDPNVCPNCGRMMKMNNAGFMTCTHGLDDDPAEVHREQLARMAQQTAGRDPATGLQIGAPPAAVGPKRKRKQNPLIVAVAPYHDGLDGTVTYRDGVEAVAHRLRTAQKALGAHCSMAAAYEIMSRVEEIKRLEKELDEALGLA